METDITKDDEQSLGRAERRFLRRLFNGRTVPVMADGKPFLTYKQASRYLESLPYDARAAPYAEMREAAKSGHVGSADEPE